MGIWDVDLKTQRAIWNRRMFDIYGLSEESFSGQIEDWKKCIHPDDLAAVSLRAKTSLTESGAFEADFRIVTSTGEIKWIKAMGRMETDLEGNPARAVGIHLDETPARVLDVELEHNRDDSKKAELLARVGNWSLDIKIGSVIWSEGLYAILGLDPANRTPTLSAHSRFFSEENFQIMQKAVDQCIDSGTPYSLDLAATREDGMPFFVNIKGNAARDARGDVVEIYGTALDITEQKQAEIKIQEANEELRVANAKLQSTLAQAEALTRAAKAVDTERSSLLAVMSHEIRTPLNAILGMASLLETTELTYEQTEYVETLSSSGQSLAALLNDILDFSKLEAGKITLEQKPFSLLNVTHETVMMFAGAAWDKGVELTYSVGPEFHDAVRGDFFRLKQILINLLSNALKFTDQGGVSLRLETTRLLDSGVTLKILVQDTGIGISKRSLENLFHPFQQADSSITRKFGGTGLGLAICEQLVGLMNGKFHVESELGLGSTFEFSVELESHLHGSEPVKVCAGLKIAYYSRSAHHQKMLASLVAYLGGELSQVSSPEEVAFLRPEILLMDTAWFSALDAETLGKWNAVEVHRLGEKVISECPKLTIPCSVKQLEDCLKRTLPELRKIISLPKNSPAALRILVAEDNKINQRVISLMLTKLGLSADVVANGAEALRELSLKKYDLVLMDLQMPDVDGITATHLWRISEMQTGGRVYICALTANATEGDRQRCLEVGMDDYLAKPVVLARLREMFERATATLAKWN